MTDHNLHDDSQTSATKPRRRWVRWVVGIVLAALVIGGIGVGFKVYRWNSMGGHERVLYLQDYMHSSISRHLNLTPAQQQKLDAFIAVLSQQRKQLKLRTWREQALQTIEGAKFDRAAAQALVNHLTQTVQNASPEVITAAADFYDSLQPAQQAQVRERLEHVGRRGKHRGHGHEHH